MKTKTYLFLSLLVLVALVVLVSLFYKNTSPNEEEMMAVSLYVQNKQAAATSDCGVTEKVAVSLPKTEAVADASLRFLFEQELSAYGTYDSLTIADKVAQVKLASDHTSSGAPLSSLSSCQITHLTSVLHDTLTQYPTITTVELYSPQGKIDF
jgi:hypothetical protein